VGVCVCGGVCTCSSRWLVCIFSSSFSLWIIWCGGWSGWDLVRKSEGVVFLTVVRLDCGVVWCCSFQRWALTAGRSCTQRWLVVVDRRVGQMDKCMS